LWHSAEIVAGLPVLFATADLAVTGCRRTAVIGAAAAVAAGYRLRSWRGGTLRV
jgi:hypothetical protein